MTVFKHESLLTTGSGSNPGVLITAGAGAATTQPAFKVQDLIAAPIFQVSGNWSTSAGGLVFGDRIGAYRLGNAGSCGARGRGAEDVPACLQWADGTAKGLKMWTSSAASPSITGQQLGDLMIRKDTPSTAGQRIYRWDGTSWVGVL